jgi:hypothetical protein
VRGSFFALFLMGCAASSPAPLPYFKESPESWDHVGVDAALAADGAPDAAPTAANGDSGAGEAGVTAPLVTDELPYRPSHPAPRVQVDVTKVTGRAKSEDVQRVARSKGYWPIRSCYEDGLRRAGRLRGEIELRATLAGGGAVESVHRSAVHVDDRDVVTCIVKAVRKLSLVPARGGATATLLIALNPGDEPVGAREPAPWPVTPEDLRTSLRARLPDMETCFKDGLRRDADLAGRLAVRLRIGSSGQVREAKEVESRFPDPEVKTCVLDVLRKTSVTGGGKELVVVYAVRFGAARDDDAPAH